MNKELLEKYCSNCCTEEELSYVLTWFEESGKTFEGKALLFMIWNELPLEGSNLNLDFDLLLDKIHHKVNLTKTEKLLQKSDQNLIKYKRKENFIKILTRAAAILMLPVLSFGLYMSINYQTTRGDQISVNQTYNEVFSSVDAITKVTLPDGSTVWLNHSSSIKYSAMFIGNSRNVELCGEGYFEVATNPQKPFIVKAGKIQVIATGTTFNILAYPDEDRIETFLLKGKVDLKKIDLNGKEIPLLTMKPAQLALFQKSDDEISTKTINDDRNISWKDGKLVFKNEPLGEVVEKLSRWFNVDIQINDPELMKLTYTATFIHETLPQVMELISLMSPISYSISDRNNISSGTFSKRKVIMNYKKK